MKTPARFARTLVTAALAAAGCGAALADDEETRLRTPGSRIDAGLGYLDRDAARFGLHNGWYERGTSGLLGFELVRRDDATGSWTIARGRNLGLPTQEAGLEYTRQGNVSIFATYSETRRREPYTIFTGLEGIGSGTLRVNGTGRRDVNLQLDRAITRLGIEKHFSPTLSAAVVLTDHRKDGDRMYGRGTQGAMEFLADPAHYTMRALEGTVSYAGERLQLAGGYYATAFDNAHTALWIVGGNAALAGGAVPLNPLALPPDNESRQVYLSGGYNVTRGTRVSFKVSRQRATQDDEFILAPASVVGRDDLGGRVETTLAQLGLSTRVTPRLALNASVRHEDRDDRTPLAQYFTGVTPTGTSDGFNEPRSMRSTHAKLEAHYALPGPWRVGGKYEFDRRKRNTSPVRVVSHRDETEEHTLSLEARRPITESLNGYVTLQRSQRGGSEFLVNTLVNGQPGSNVLAPLTLADRDRDRVRAMLDWSVRDRFAVQLVAEASSDDYERGTRVLGLERGRARHLGVDASWAATPTWRVNAWAGLDENRARQRSQAGAPAGSLTRATLTMRGEAFGVGLRGSRARVFDAAIDLSQFRNRSAFVQETLGGAAAPFVPDIHYRQTTLNATLSVPLTPDLSLRAQYIHDRWNTDDWTWSNFTYIDGTRVLQDARQRANFFGLGVTMLWR